MKKLIHLFIGVILIISVGCTGVQGNSSDDLVNGDKNEDMSQEESLEATNGLEKEFVDFSQKQNWGTAYSYMKAIGKPVKEVADNYTNWTLVGAPEASVVYKNPENELQYWFDLPGNINDFYGKKLIGDEICSGIGGDVGYFFPDAVWPQNISETEGYVKSYLGLNFETFPDDSDSPEGCWYYVDLEQNNCLVRIYSKTGIITNETGMLIYGDGIILE